MIICPSCGERGIRKNGIIRREIMAKRGTSIQKVQTYLCKNGHRFTKAKRSCGIIVL